MTEIVQDASVSQCSAFQSLLRERHREFYAARREALEQIQQAEAKVAAATARAETAERRLAEMSFSRLRRAAAHLRRLVVAQPVPPAEPTAELAPTSSDPYQGWLERFDRLTAADEALLQREAEAPGLPGLVVLHPLVDSDTAAVLAALSRQFYTRWRLLLVLHSGICPEDPRIAAAAAHPHVQLLRAGDVPPGVGLGVGERLVLLRPGTLPRDHALGRLAAAAQDDAVRLAYADEDRIDRAGARCSPFFKPDFSPALLQSLDYLGGLVLLGGPTENLEAVLCSIVGGEDPDATVRNFAVALRGDAVVHLTEILSHDFRSSGSTQTRPQQDAPQQVPDLLASIIIPLRDRADLLRPCLESVFATVGELAEVILVDNGSREIETLRLLEQLESSGKARVIRAPGSFNYSRLNNVAVAAARGEVLVFLNNDTLVHDPTWLHHLLNAAAPEDVGAVGVKLLYPDLTVQHGGIVLGADGTVAHLDVGLAADDPGYHGLATATREVSAVTGACLAMRRAVFDRIGGFDEGLAVAFNDVKLCLDALELGFRNVRIAAPLLLHHEAKSRGRDDTHDRIAVFRAEARRARAAHRALFLDDPYYNPNLSLQRLGELAVPPRQIRPWRRAGRGGRLRIVIAAVTHEWNRVPAAFVARQADELRRRGHEVIVAGPRGACEPQYAGCERVHLTEPEALAVLAVERAADWVVAHSQPFLSVSRWLGRACRTAICDYGDPQRALFPDADSHFAAVAEVQLCRDVADLVLPGGGRPMGAASLGNFGMAPAPAVMAERRNRLRETRGWTGKAVILTSIPLANGERTWSGLPAFLALANAMDLNHPALALRSVFVANGGGSPADVNDVAARGVAVVPDDLTASEEVFAAADVYLDLSLSPEFGLGLNRALAYGLPVIASNLPANRLLPITLSDDMDVVLKATASCVTNVSFENTRQPLLFPMAKNIDLSARIESFVPN